MFWYTYDDTICFLFRQLLQTCKRCMIRNTIRAMCIMDTCNTVFCTTNISLLCTIRLFVLLRVLLLFISVFRTVEVILRVYSTRNFVQICMCLSLCAPTPVIYVFRKIHLSVSPSYRISSSISF